MIKNIYKVIIDNGMCWEDHVQLFSVIAADNEEEAGKYALAEWGHEVIRNSHDEKWEVSSVDLVFENVTIPTVYGPRQE